MPSVVALEPAQRYRHADFGTQGRSLSFDSGINDAGQLAGGFITAAGEDHAFTGPNGLGFTDLDSLVRIRDGTHLRRNPYGHPMCTLPHITGSSSMGKARLDSTAPVVPSVHPHPCGEHAVRWRPGRY